MVGNQGFSLFWIKILKFINFVHKIALGAHFRCSKITYHVFPISDQLTIFYYFSKWPPAVTIFVSQYGHWQPFSMTENHFRSHFSSFQINTQLFIFFKLFYKMAAAGHFGIPKITVKHFSPFQINTHVFL